MYYVTESHLKLNPNSTFKRVVLVGAKDEAIAAYNRAIEIDPEHEFAVSVPCPDVVWRCGHPCTLATHSSAPSSRAQ